MPFKCNLQRYAEDDTPKDPGHVDPAKLPPIWDQRTARVLSAFEKMSLEIRPMVGLCTLNSFDP